MVREATSQFPHRARIGPPGRDGAFRSGGVDFGLNEAGQSVVEVPAGARKLRDVPEDP